MATRASFQDLADKLINKTFADFRDEVLLQQVESDYATQSNIVVKSDVTKGIRIEYSKGDIGDSIQVGDYKIKMVKQGLSVDVRADNTVMTFNGVPVSIIRVTEDASNATYTIQARNK